MIKRINIMHRLRNERRIKDGPQTTGKTLHWAGEYDFFSRLMGMGVNSRNSRMVIELAKVKSGDNVLDVACGSGNLTLTAQTCAGETGKVVGIDASPEMIEVAKKKALRSSSPVVFQVGLAEKLDFPAGTFDVVISRLAIHHLPDDLKAKAFAEILRVLKPGGHVLIADFVAPSNHILNHLTSALIGSHMMQTSAWSLPPMLTNAGFVDVASGPTRSSMLAFVSGKKPAS
jgi:demethylmenaquinone methyltransferase/2-methoxy-6-polyprenyl-1,4-benzoquinol methylase/phosphoethanolamine N-methyltransferase